VSRSSRDVAEPDAPAGPALELRAAADSGCLSGLLTGSVAVESFVEALGRRSSGSTTLVLG